ncbi:protein GIGAS CELL1-like isoform X2 [Chenopodium quinoa]|uniref:Uncharacterized protein n=2 Tax=Chenopodium quinoa TaxID=63459 RepID=A0A803M5M7_CHEQI|nr:protein GIGAS CELL1-like isoform X2 [Chenopodium quinoa]
MHPSRDRLPRPVDISSLLQNAERQVDLVVDEPGLRWMGLSTQNVSTGQSSGDNVKSNKQRAGLQRIRHRRRYMNRSLVGKENQRPRSVKKGHGSSILPSWYPRVPLRDITAIVRAIERKRAELRDHQTLETPQQEAEASTSNSQPDEKSISTTKPEACKVRDRNADHKGKETADIFTPRKRLLGSIDKVRHIWLEDQRKLEKTPAAKKAERQKMVRVLMSMR